MVLSSFAIRSRFSDVVGKLFSKVTRFLFGLPSVCSATIILSLIGGFPIGAKCVRILYDKKEITILQAQQMMLFCICSGPAFLITAVGTIMIGNITVGVILYISQVLSCIILGIISRFLYLKRNTYQRLFSDKNKTELPKINIISSFILSCSDGAKSITEMTALVVLFSLLINTAEQKGIFFFISQIFSVLGADNRFSEAIIPIIFEVTGACSKVCEETLPLWLLSFAVGFGGLCVHFQIFGILGELHINKLQFLLFRLINAIFSAIITYIICIFYNPTLYIFATADISGRAVSSSSPAGAIALVIMSVVFLLSLRKTLSFNKKSALLRNKNME